MDIKSKRWVKNGQGSAASQDTGDYVSRSCSWQMGALASTEAIEAEKVENDKRFGVPCEDNLPNPADSNSDADAPLPTPNSFSNNPGFFGASTGALSVGRGMVHSTAPQQSVVSSGRTMGRSATRGFGSISNPSPGSVDPNSDMGPLNRTSGFGG